MKTLKVKSVKSLGVRPVMDLQMPSEHNFILGNGAVAHNCKSHAYSYGRISNTTAWLKYHYPIEWWCGVLSHCDTKKITNEYWHDAQKFVTMPSVNTSGDKFTIIGEKLVPPLSLINGIGEKGKDEIVSKAPFSSLEDLLTRVNGKSVTKKVLYALVKAGALDIFMPPDATLAEKANILLQGLIKIKDKKAKLPEEFQNLSLFKEYVLIKDALTIAPISLSEIIDKSPNISKPFLTVSHFNSDTEEILFKALRGKQILVNGTGLAALANQMPYIKEKTVDVCCYGYVKEARKFTYKNKSKTALDITIDLDGFNIKTVIWPRGGVSESPLTKEIKQGYCYLFVIKLDRNEDYRFGIVKAYEVKEKVVNVKSEASSEDPGLQRADE